MTPYADAREGMIHRWVTHGMDEEDAYVELAHNVFGMTLQWTHLIRHLSTRRNPPRTLEEAADVVLDVLPARVAASRIDDGLVLHDLEYRCRHATRPVTLAPARHPDYVGHADQEVASEYDANYLPFGVGARRCPGEWLTYILLTNLHIPYHTGPSDARRIGLTVCH